MTQPPLRSHSAWHNVTISHFTKAKELIIPPFQFSKTKDHRPNNTQAEALTWWMSSVKITANWSAEDRELQESSTGQQPRRLLMYWFGGLWNVDNLCHTFISFLWLSLVPSAPGPPQQKQAKGYCWVKLQSMPFVQGVMHGTTQNTSRLLIDMLHPNMVFLTSTLSVPQNES